MLVCTCWLVCSQFSIDGNPKREAEKDNKVGAEETDDVVGGRVDQQHQLAALFGTAGALHSGVDLRPRRLPKIVRLAEPSTAVDEHCGDVEVLFPSYRGKFN